MESYGLEDPVAVVTIGTLDDDGNSGEYVVCIGSKDGQGYVVESSESPYHVLMADFSVSDFIEKGSGDLLEAPPGATPDPSL